VITVGSNKWILIPNLGAMPLGINDNGTERDIYTREAPSYAVVIYQFDVAEVGGPVGGGVRGL
jgi:hypothetical protein